EEQLAAYRKVIEAAPNHSVTIRTLDLGGDKNVPYLGNAREANPFMGWRSIRLSSAYPEFFGTQLRAILRAGLFGKVSLLFPMISTLEEVQRLKRVVNRTRTALRRECGLAAVLFAAVRAGSAATDHESGVCVVDQGDGAALEGGTGPGGGPAGAPDAHHRRGARLIGAQDPASVPERGISRFAP